MKSKLICHTTAYIYCSCIGTRTVHFYFINAKFAITTSKTNSITVGVWGSNVSRAALRQMQTVKDALLRATFDPDARVRGEAATALGHLPFSGSAALDIVVRVRSLARTDRSLLVRGAALAADLRLEKNAAIPLAKTMMAPEVWQNAIRGQALNALKEIDTPEARQLLQQYAPVAH